MKAWEKIGARQPFWGVLTQESNLRQHVDIESFYRKGGRAVKRVLKRVDELGGVERGRALDFGCGVGRLTHGLASHFEKVDGVDISPGMLEEAQKHMDSKNVTFHLNPRADLAVFEPNSFDFIISMITLQHMPKDHMKIYLDEMIRVLSPTGMMCFQIPSHWRIQERNEKKGLLSNLVAQIRKYVYGLRGQMEMNTYSKEDMLTFLKERNMTVLQVFEDGAAGPDYVSYTYLVRPDKK